MKPLAVHEYRSKKQWQMSTNYNIKRNKARLTDADIAKGQNFDSFMKAYNGSKPSFFKTPKFYALATVTVAIIAAGTWMVLKNDDSSVAQNNPAFIQPLFAGAENPDTTFLVDATRGGILMNSNGSVIAVPGSAFRDSAGNPVSGQVELHYKEFHDVAKIFMAGIPMSYDSAGAPWNFESAGMIEITAWQNGKPLKTNPDSLIKVAMVSNSDEERFNTYYLDTAAKNWKYINDKQAFVFHAGDSVAADTNAIAVLPEPPVAPKVATKNAPSFAISFDQKEFPELVAYKGVRFEVDETQTPYNKEDKKVQWEDVVIRRVKGKDWLRVKFTAGTRETEYITHPVVDEKDYQAAYASWEKRNADYLKLKQQRDDQEKQAADQKQANMEKQEQHRIWLNDSLARLASQRRAAASLQEEKQDLVMREFIISDFGIWNADCPEALPDEEQIFVKAVDQNGTPLDANMYYLVEKGKNALYMYMASHMGTFGYDPAQENMVWAVTKEGKLAVLSVADFKNATASDKKEVTFKFTVGTDKLKDAAEARRVLDIPPPVGM